MSRLPSLGTLALILLACGRGERKAAERNGPRLDTSLHAARPFVITVDTGAARNGEEFFASFQDIYRLSDSDRATLSDSDLAALDFQPHDAYDSLARELDRAADAHEARIAVVGEEEHPQAAVLTLGDFHGGEVSEGDAGREWLGLYADSSGGFRLGRTRVRIARFFDEVMDTDASEPTGKRVTATVDQAYRILVDGLPYLDEGPVPALDTLGGELPPGSRRAFAFRGTEYRLAATIRPPHRSRDGQIHTTRDYRLFLTAVRGGNKVTQMILKIGELDDKVPGLGFAGDVDGDGRLDLVLDDSGHYNVGTASLYLSRPAEAGTLLKRVGTRRSTGC